MPSVSARFLAVTLMAAPLSRASAGAERSFPAGSLVIPMDLAYQDHGLLQAYGLVFQLLRQQVHVSWAINPGKSWHAAPCDTPGGECTWDCADEGSGVKCPYPTASPDFFAGTKVVWDGEGRAAGTAISSHGYRGGPFVIDAADRERALRIVNVWNDQAQWAANPWARRTVFQVVSVHEATGAFRAYVRKEMVAAPTIAVFSDGNEHIATSYLRAAGIPQSNGSEFPDARCAAGTCGAGEPNPDMLTVPSVAGDMGTCDAPNRDHRNGQLFRDGVPAYCQIMSMHWNVADRELVECGGGPCPTRQADCSGVPITYHGHEVVAEVRAFLNSPVHFFAECQAVNAYENTTRNPAWPYLDDVGRDGHFLTTTGTPPGCAGGTCTNGDFQCVPLGCDGGTRDCCQPRDLKELGAGFLIAPQPASRTVRILHPEVPYNQLDGQFATVGGSEPAYNLSRYLGTTYKSSLDVTFITGPNGPGEQDVWMTGYVDGTCNITCAPGEELCDPKCQSTAGKALGKVSYLGGHAYKTAVPLSANPDSQGTRLFLNALFEADCVTADGQPQLAVTLTGDTRVPVAAAQGSYLIAFENRGPAGALDGELRLDFPAGVSVLDAGGGTVEGPSVKYPIGTIGPLGSAAPRASTSRTVRLSFAGEGSYTLSARLFYRVGVTTLIAGPSTLAVGVGVEPPASDGGTGVDGGAGPDGGASGPRVKSGGCGCPVSGGGAGSLWLVCLVGGMLLRRRRT